MARIAIVLGSTRQGRFGEKPARWVQEHLEAREDVEVDLIDLRDHPLPNFDAPPPAFTLRQYSSPEVAKLGERIDAADGFILMTPEYNHGYSGAIKNAMDATFVEWQRKPAAFVGWGGVGGARAIEQLRLVAVEFEMAPLRHAVHILPDILMPGLQSDYDPALFAPLNPRLATLVDDLLWWTNALVAARQPAAG
jgi:NAD(P)H-dependent FMN reductase